MTKRLTNQPEIIRLVTIGGLLVLALAIAIKNLGSSHSSAATRELPLPSSLVLAHWNLIQKTEIKPEPQKQNRGVIYHYQSQTTPRQDLRLEIRAEPNTEGNVSRLVSLHQQIQPAVLDWKIETIPQEGTFAFYYYQKQLHLTACLDAQGDSTITEQQFRQKHLTFSHLFPRLFLWLMGKQSLSDSDGWWILLSLPIRETASSTQIKQGVIQLINAWRSLKLNAFFQS